MIATRPVYLDYNATAPVRPAAVAAVVAALAEPGNASSVHRFGRSARRTLEQARRDVGDAVAALADEVVFTSGGTEANNLALASAPGPVAVSAIEHPSVLEARPDAWRIPAGPDGLVDLTALDRMIRQQPPRLVSVMLANNETGVIQPVAEVAAMARRCGALLHVDAAQALGRIPVDRASMGADLLSLSAHKLGGPPGAGALVVRRGLELVPGQRGGGQEQRRRAGTEPLPAILGFAAALTSIPKGEAEHVGRLRQKLEECILNNCNSVRIVGRESARLPNTSCILLPGVDAALQLMRLDLAGVAVSSGAACSSGKVGASHVLLAMGLDDALARCAVRVSLGWASTADDVERFVSVWVAMTPEASGKVDTCVAAPEPDIHGRGAGGVARWACN